MTNSNYAGGYGLYQLILAPAIWAVLFRYRAQVEKDIFS